MCIPDTESLSFLIVLLTICYYFLLKHMVLLLEWYDAYLTTKEILRNII